MFSKLFPVSPAQNFRMIASLLLLLNVQIASSAVIYDFKGTVRDIQQYDGLGNFISLGEYNGLSISDSFNGSMVINNLTPKRKTSTSRTYFDDTGYAQINLPGKTLRSSSIRAGVVANNPVFGDLFNFDGGTANDLSFGIGLANNNRFLDDLNLVGQNEINRLDFDRAIEVTGDANNWFSFRDKNDNSSVSVLFNINNFKEISSDGDGGNSGSINLKGLTNLQIGNQKIAISPNTKLSDSKGFALAGSSGTQVLLNSEVAGRVLAAEDAITMIDIVSGNDQSTSLIELLEEQNRVATAAKGIDSVGNAAIASLTTSLANTISGKNPITPETFKDGAKELADQIVDKSTVILVVGKGVKKEAVSLLTEFNSEIEKINELRDQGKAVSIERISYVTDLWLEGAAKAREASAWLKASSNSADTGNAMKDFWINLKTKTVEVGTNLLQEFTDDFLEDHAARSKDVKELQEVKNLFDTEMSAFSDASGLIETLVILGNGVDLSRPNNPIETDEVLAAYSGIAADRGWTAPDLDEANARVVSSEDASFSGAGTGAVEGGQYFLTTGSPVRLTHELNGSKFDFLTFDYLFEQNAGIFEVFLDDESLGSFGSNSSEVGQWINFVLGVENDDRKYFNQLSIVLDGPSGLKGRIRDIALIESAHSVNEPRTIALVILGFFLLIAQRRYRFRSFSA